ncbi:MAG: 4Fe-4S binding protein [Defluviitaleaceae bacterium]|nr:4Fe-4S binding protein [Defluviitaleaceae bacterium]
MQASNCNDPNRTRKIPVTCTDSNCCSGDSNCCDTSDAYNVNSRDSTPYGRIIIDYDKCTRCGLCVKECCGTAIGLFPEDFKI